MIRVLLADDQAVVRAGLRTILGARADVEVIAEAADGAEAVTLATALKPDVVMMDIRMPVVDGIEATRRLAALTTPTRVLVLTTYGIDEYVYEALRAGAAGFLLKTDPPERIVDAVRVVAAGDALLGPDTTRRLIERFLASPAPRLPVGGAEHPHRSRTRRTAPCGTRTVQPGDRHRPVHRRGHRQDARRAHPLQTRPPRPGTSRRVRL